MNTTFQVADNWCECRSPWLYTRPGRRWGWSCVAQNLYTLCCWTDLAIGEISRFRDCWAYEIDWRGMAGM